MIEPSEETPSGQGCKHNSLSNDVHTAAMYQKHRKRRSELQRRHDILLHQSRRDPAAYQVATLQDFSETVKVYRERARAAEADTEHSKKLLISTQNQVGH